MDVLHEICRRARSKNARIIIDAESQHYQKGIFLVGMELAHIYNRDGCARIYNTYQAYLKSTAATLDTHLKQAAEEGFTLGLKLVRGAYMSSDKRSLIHDTKQDTDNAYNAISQGALKCEIGRFGAPGGLPFPSVNLFLASHNRESLMAAHKTHQSRVQLGLQTVQLDFAQLHGMSDDLSFDLVQMGARGDHTPGVYKCSTWGTLGQCLAYLMRRAAENRDAVSRSSDEYRALKKEIRGRLGFRRNLGLAILQNLVTPPETADATKLPIQRFTVCVRSSATEQKLADKFRTNADTVTVSSGKNLQAMKKADVIILAVDPADIASTLKEQGVAEALSSTNNGRPRLLISVAAGWTRQDLEKTIFGTPTNSSNANSGRTWVIRTLPNVAAQVAQSLTAVEISDPAPPDWALELCDTIFNQIGKTVHIPPALMDATTALGGSTPAFFAVVCDALIDAAVAVGVPRPLAHTMTFQSMLGTATMMQGGLHPALLKDQGTSPEGCTIGGLMVLEEGAVRGHIGKALREAVTIARQMGKNPHVNDTRQ
ncbi:hypothetical protein ACHAP6_001155 [Verticillium nonalfalfae]